MWLCEDDGSEGTILDKATRWLKKQRAETPYRPGRRSSVGRRSLRSTISLDHISFNARMSSTTTPGRLSSTAAAEEPRPRSKLEMLRQVVTFFAAGGDDDDGDGDLDMVSATDSALGLLHAYEGVHFIRSACAAGVQGQQGNRPAVPARRADAAEVGGYHGAPASLEANEVPAHSDSEW